MTPEIVEQGTGVGGLGRQHDDPVGTDPGYHRESASAFEHHRLERTQPGGLGERTGLSGEGCGQRRGRIGIERVASAAVNRQAIGVQKHHGGDVGAVGKGPHDLSQSGQTTPSEHGVKKGERNVWFDESEVKQ